MRKLTFLLLLMASINLYSQKRIPELTIYNLKGDRFKTSQIFKHDGPVIIAFWATWCKPCINELSAFNDELEDLEEELNLKLVAISIDDSRSNSKLRSFVRGKGWEFDIFNDNNQELKRKLGITSIPHTLVLNKNGEIVWEHNSYTPGTEEEIFEIIRKLSNEK
jgi:thiol-disulfide isomerase/thioredoxin